MLAQNADVICIQELKAQVDQLDIDVFHPAGFHVYLHAAEKKGYSGVALYCRQKPDKVKIGIGWPDFDSEGRYIQADFGKLSVASLYVPSGSSGEPRQSIKFDWLKRFKPELMRYRRQRRDYIICGDFNIAHKQIDLKNWRSNQKNSGFLPEEREWMDWLFGTAGFVDVFRRLDDRADQYTWWSNRGQAWAKNVGWRLDYQIATPKIAKTAVATSIYTDQRFSDHAPLLVDYDHQLGYAR
jgi:exodeoxyribonuclease-3